MNNHEKNTEWWRKVLHYVQGFVVGALFVNIVYGMRPFLPRSASTSNYRNAVFGPSGQILALVSTNDNSIIIRDVVDGNQISQLATDNRVLVRSVAFSPDGRVLATDCIKSDTDGARIGGIDLWDVASGRLLNRTFPDRLGLFQVVQKPLRILTRFLHLEDPRLFPGGSITYSVTFSPSGQRLASGGTNGTIVLYHVENDQLEDVDSFTITPQSKATVTNLAFSPDDQTLASVGDDGTIILWRYINNERVKRRIPNPDFLVSSLAFSPDGQILALGGSVTRENPNGTLSHAGAIRLWDITNDKPLRQFWTKSRGYVSSLAFSPTGKMLASSSADGTLILWDIGTGNPLGQSLDGHETPALSLAFSPGGEALTSRHADGSIFVWDVPGVIAQLCRCRTLMTQLGRGE